MAEDGKDLWRVSSEPLDQAGIITAACPELCPDSFLNISREGDYTVYLHHL